MVALVPQFPGASAGGPGLPSCWTSGVSSGVTSGGSCGCFTSTGTSSQNHNLTGNQPPPPPPIQIISGAGILSTPSVALNMNSYALQFSATDPSVLPPLQPLDVCLRGRLDSIVSAHTATDPLPAIGTLLKSYGLGPFSLMHICIALSSTFCLRFGQARSLLPALLRISNSNFF